LTGRRTVNFEDDTVKTSVYARNRLPADKTISGPAIVEGDESTVAIKPGQQARVDEYGNITVSVNQ